MRTWAALPIAFWLSGCAPAPSPSQASLTINSINAEAALRAASCTVDTDKYEPSPLTLNSASVSLGPNTDVEAALPLNIQFIGGWHLTSRDPEFGGLSGLAILPSGDLLSVSDKGYAITIALSEDTPTGQATIMPLLDADGRILTGKADGDAEGLAYRDGLAFISFERHHRILAYDFGRCGVAAKGVFFAGLPKAQLGARIAANDGAEALDFDSRGRVRAGYETIINGQAPRVIFDADGIARETPEFLGVEDGFKLVGADHNFTLFRAYDSTLGNRNVVVGPNVNFRLTPPMHVDNFEGIAIREVADSEAFIYLISDDNYSSRQRTLLYIFKVTD